MTTTTRESFWRERTVVVTGATGFLGGWLVRRLLELDARVIAIARSHKPECQFFLTGADRRTITEYGDLSNPQFLESVFGKYGVEFFFHAAYGGDVNQALREPFECFRAAESTWRILELLRRTKSNCISVISSSDKVYGTQELPYREDRPLNPLHPYEVGKATQDYAAQSYGKIFGVPTVVSRCANYFGGYDFNLTRLIPGVLKNLAAGERPVLRSDGRFTRDFLYIEDAVDVQLLLAERLAADPSLAGEAFNFSYGQQIEVLEIVNRILQLTGSDLTPQVNDSVQAEIRHMHLSSDKAKDRLGWTPVVGFDAGLEQTVRWYESYFRGQAGSRAHHSVA